MKWKIGPVEYFSSDEYFRPSLWIERRKGGRLIGFCIVFFGWQRPSILHI